MFKDLARELKDWFMPPHEEARYFLPELHDGNYARVEEALGWLSGVQTPSINTLTRRVAVDFLPSCVSKAEIEAALCAAGFNPEAID